MGPIAPGPSQHMMVSPHIVVRLSKCLLILWLGEHVEQDILFELLLFFGDCMLSSTDALFLHAGGRCFLRQSQVIKIYK